MIPTFTVNMFGEGAAADADETTSGDLSPVNMAGKRPACPVLQHSVAQRQQGAEQAGRCMVWKDKEHHREKQGVQLCMK